MRVLVTGGGGFVGGAVVDELLARGHEVSSLGRSPRPALEERGVRAHVGDLGDGEDVARAVAGHDAVVHTAAKTGVWGKRSDFRRTNVTGTRNVLAACRAHGVERLVHTSSPSVCFDGKGHRNARNDLPLASRFLCAYPETKAAAESLVLSADREGRLATCVLRPHLVIGPGDPHIVPRLLDRGRRGRLAIVGDGTNEVSLTDVENAAVAHVDALEALEPGARHAGRAYFIAQREPVRMWDWIAELFQRIGVPPVERRVPRGLAYALGGACELAWSVLPLSGEPPITRFVAQELASDHSYDVSPASNDFGYAERVGLSQATDRVVAAFAES